MAIIRATISDIDDVFNIVQCTINAIYPHYYPPGAVRYFLSHHSRNAVEQDIKFDSIWVLREGKVRGTVTIKENEIARLFVLPEYQGKGYGSRLMDFAENFVFQKHQTIILDASLPAQELYIKRGYRIAEFHKILCENSNYLCYNNMSLHKPS